jgi:fructose-1,6-bisphosphatase I
LSVEAMTLGRFVVSEEANRPREESGLASLLQSLAGAGRRIARDVRRADLVGMVGYAGDKNPSGDAQKKLDVAADRAITETVCGTGLVASLVSEEIEEGQPMSSGDEARFILCADPLDGSSNTDINGPVGTIFGISLRARRGRCDAPLEELGSEAQLIASGYIMYGPATVLVYTRGAGVNGFTLDEERGEYALTHARMQCPARGSYFSANIGKSKTWDPNLRRYVDHLLELDKASGRPYSLRYVGALVADLHRSLLEGGIYFYPADASNPNGKLRLLYECAPLALVAEQAGGGASTGRERILALRPTSLHQKVPLAIGSREDVALYERMLAGGDA